MNAILFYASEQAPGRLLPPAGSLNRIEALEACFYFTSDVIAANGLAFNLRMPLPWEKLPRLAAWHARIAERPAVQQGMTAFDPR